MKSTNSMTVGSKLFLAVSMLLIAVLVLLALPRQSSGMAIVEVDWETGNDGSPLLKGETVDTQYATGSTVLNFTVSAATDTLIYNRAIIFTSDAPAGVDTDLGSPNQACPGGGPGVGADGEPGDPGENCVDLGNVLIMPHNITDADMDGYVDAPNDSSFGGTITISFDRPVNGIALTVLDQDDASSAIVETYDGVGGLISTDSTNGFGNNSKDRILLTNANGIERIDVIFEGSGSISSFEVEPLETTAITLNSFVPGSGSFALIWVAVAIALLTIATFFVKPRRSVANRVD